MIDTAHTIYNLRWNNVSKLILNKLGIIHSIYNILQAKVDPYGICKLIDELTPSQRTKSHTLRIVHFHSSQQPICIFSILHTKCHNTLTLLFYFMYKIAIANILPINSNSPLIIGSLLHSKRHEPYKKCCNHKPQQSF